MREHPRSLTITTQYLINIISLSAQPDLETLEIISISKPASITGLIRIESIMNMRLIFDELNSTL